MLPEIRDEVSHVMVIIVLIFCIVASSVTYNKEAVWEGRYASWVFNETHRKAQALLIPSCYQKIMSSNFAQATQNSAIVMPEKNP